MAALRHLALLLLPFVLPLSLQLHATAASSSDADLLLAAKSALFDPTGALAGWQPRSVGSPCRWPHVSCSNISSNTVNGLDLSRLSLSGKFPTAFCSLWSLEYLNLSLNDLTGPLPSCLASLPMLMHLNLAGNNFSGEVPPMWGAGFRSLIVLNLVQNLLTGAFPAFVANLTTLQKLELAYNSFSPSPLPENLGDLTNLRVLFVAHCSLIGNIPSSIGRLRNLQNLDISSNNLTGKIPRGIRYLTSLEQIELYSNHLSGKIPVGLGGLRKLRWLDMSMNHLTGKIPEDMFTAPSLESVHIYMNNLTGSLPATLATTPSLSDLRIFSNQLEGPLPREFGKNCPLEVLDTSDNRLSGPIPAELCASGKLSQIMLLNNEFEGAIPVELGQCRTLTRIRLHSNRLCGPVAPEIWGLPNVFLLELRDNALSGTIASAIAAAKNLSKLLMQDNQFTGALPVELGTLPLQELVASNNHFSGALPPSLVNLSEVFKLDLSNNSLSGVILPGFSKLKKLALLDLSNNHLSGSIPPEIGDIDDLNYLDLSNNELSGTLPMQLENIKLSHLNVSYNKLYGPIPSFFNSLSFRDSFLGNPGLCYGFCQSNDNSGNKWLILLKSSVVVLIVSVFLLVLSVGCFMYKCRSRAHKGVGSESEYEESPWVLTSFHNLGFSERPIVNGLTENNLIGQSVVGKVYKAVVGPHGAAMAVKKLLWTGARQRNETFEAEVNKLMQVRHMNTVNLACCITNRVCTLLVYEYMPRGSLGDFLHSAKSTILSWPMRYKIACDAAKGLSYLHHDCVPPIIHRDVKSSNILLDADFGAKVGDFGVAKILGSGSANFPLVDASHGYIPPEFCYTARITEKSDIYSFGVVLLEIVTGKNPMAPEIKGNLVSWVSSRIELNGPESVLDQTIPEQFKDEMTKVMQIAQCCVTRLPRHRPPMRRVVNMLHYYMRSRL